MNGDDDTSLQNTTFELILRTFCGRPNFESVHVVRGYQRILRWEIIVSEDHLVIITVVFREETFFAQEIVSL